MGCSFEANSTIAVGVVEFMAKVTRLLAPLFVLIWVAEASSPIIDPTSGTAVAVTVKLETNVVPVRKLFPAVLFRGAFVQVMPLSVQLSAESGRKRSWPV